MLQRVSEDFLALNEKDFLAELDLGNEIVNCATKKDSRSQYFQLRNEVFEILDKKTQKFFEKIQNIAVTLDKVTGKSFSEALILASTSPKFDKRLLIDLPVQSMKTTSSEHIVYINCFEYQNKKRNNLCTDLAVFMY